MRCDICGAPFHSEWSLRVHLGVGIAGRCRGNLEEPPSIMSTEDYLGVPLIEALRRFVMTSPEYIEHYA